MEGFEAVKARRKQSIKDLVLEEFSGFNTEIEFDGNSILIDTLMTRDTNWETEREIEFMDDKISIGVTQEYQAIERNPINANARASRFMKMRKGDDLDCTVSINDDDGHVGDFIVKSSCYGVELVDYNTKPEKVLEELKKLEDKVHWKGTVPAYNMDISLKSPIERLEDEEISGSSIFIKEDPCEYPEIDWEDYYTPEQIEKMCGD